MKRPETLIRLTIIAVSAAYAGLLWLSGVDLDSGPKRFVAALPIVGTVLSVAWDLWLWRMHGINRFLRRPRLDGLWTITLTPTAKSLIPDGGNRGPINGYLEIVQSYWFVHARLYTAESASVSRMFFWENPSGSEIDQLAFLYDSTAKPRHESRSPRHLGCCTLAPTTHTPSEVTGEYFTARYTRGEVELRLVDRSKGHASFDAAEGYTRSL